MACDAEKTALKEARSTFSRAADAFDRAALMYTGSTVTVVAAGANVVVTVLKRNPWQIAATFLIGAILGNAAAEENAEQVGEDYRIAKEKYDQAKDAYCRCVLASLPPDTG